MSDQSGLINLINDHPTMAHVGDIGGAILALLSILGGFAQLINPILTMLLSALGIGWFIVRFRHFSRTGTMNGE